MMDLKTTIRNTNVVNNQLTLVFLLTVISTLILFGSRFALFSLLAFIIGCFIIVANERLSIILLFFFLPFATIFKISAGSRLTSLFTLWEFFYVFVHFWKRRFKAETSEVYVFLFILYLVIIELLNGSFDLFITLKMFVYLLLLKDFIYKIDTENYKMHVLLAYIYGFLVTSIVRFLNPSFLLLDNFMKLKTERVAGVFISRFSALYGDPNYYVVNLIIAISLLALLYSKRMISGVHSLILSLILVFFVSQSGSKSGLFMLIVPIAIYLYIFILQKKYHMVVLFSGLAFWSITAIFSGKTSFFAVVLERLSSDIGFTSGRTGVWKEYIAFLSEHLEYLFFGKSIANYTLAGIAAHNTYLDLLFEFGIIGSLLFFILLISIQRRKQIAFKKNLVNYSVIVVIFVMYFFLSELQYFDPVFHITIAILIKNTDFSILKNTWLNADNPVDEDNSDRVSSETNSESYYNEVHK